MSSQVGTFQEALELVESLPAQQQDELIDIIRRRNIERRREEIVQDIKEARAEYARGECRQGSVEDLMKELDG